ncbi:EpsG family protein [Stenotrophomonas sp. TWI602]|uniref:EpsG family protein n=1 Tax=Stenotrophomonas sp. TWI602 TaxID=3136786 RepID=UPI00320AAF63
MMLLLLVAPVFIYGFSLVAMRSLDAGNDTPRYVSTYNQLNGLSTSVSVGIRTYGNTEFLWWPLQSVIKPFLSPRGWLITNYLLVFYFVGMYYKKSARTLGVNAQVFALVFLTFFLIYSGNIMRQALAVPIGALGFWLFYQRRFLFASLAIAISIGLHWSCLVFLTAPALLLPFFNRDRVYLLIPLLSLALSILSSQIIGDLVNALGVAQISDKFNLYFSADHQSHIGAVWKTANFWICTLSSFTFLLVSKPSLHADKSIHIYSLLFLSLVLFGVNTADFSERYIPFLLLVLPLQIAAIINSVNAPAVIKSLAYFGFFLVLAGLVFFAESSQYTLGYTI